MEELNAKIAELERLKATCLQRQDTLKKSQWTEVLDQLRATIQAKGYSVQEVAEALLTKKPVRRRAKAGESPGKRWVNPEDAEQTYTRGKLPNWFRDAMVNLGLDPEVKADRETFKRDYLRAA